MGDLTTIVQGSAEWFAARIGHLTSSRIADAVRKRKRKGVLGHSVEDDLQCRIDLRLELAVERVTQKISEHYVSRWMERGLEMEPAARFAYEQRTDTETEQVGFVLHPDIQWAGCSPDGLVGADGLVEFKCPKSNTHAGYLLAECVPEAYVPQMMWQMACTGRRFNDFVSYCPDFPEPLDLFVCRLERDDAKIAEMEAEARRFLDEVEAVTLQLKNGLECVLAHSLERVRGIGQNGENTPPGPRLCEESMSRPPKAVIPALDEG